MQKKRGEDSRGKMKNKKKFGSLQLKKKFQLVLFFFCTEKKNK